MNEVSTQGMPKNDEIEITILGISDNSGESIVIHVGNGEWVVIDSCKTKDGKVLPLYYLNEIGVDLNKVVRVACTHLHSDHIGGLSEVLSQCKQARFAFSLVGDENTMKYIIAQEKKNASLPNGGTFGEFMKCIRVCKEENRKCIQIGLDQPIYVGNKGQILGISPSMKMSEIYQYCLIKYNVGNDEPKRMLETNFCSVASILLAGNVNAILGADLEANRSAEASIEDCIKTCRKREKRGWCNVFDYSQYFSHNNYDYIKLPHHSSINGYCPKLWANYMSDYTIGTSTIFQQGRVALPADEMIKKYSSHCKELYCTSSLPTLRKDKKGKSKLDEMKGVAMCDMIIVQSEIGIITSRKSINGFDKWKTNTYQSAIRIK